MMIYFDDGTMTTVKPSVMRVRGDSQVIDRQSPYLGPGTMRGPATRAWHQPPEAQSWFTAALGGISQVGPTQRRMYPSQTMATSAKPRYKPPGSDQIFTPVRLKTKRRPRFRQTTVPSSSMPTDNSVSKAGKKIRRKRNVSTRAQPKRKALKLKPGK